jgi:hypothetical protein
VKSFIVWRDGKEVTHYLYQSIDGIIPYESDWDLGETAVVFIQK